MKTYPAPGTAEFSDLLIGILAEGHKLAPKGANGVGGSSGALIWRDRGGDVEPRHLNHGPKSEMTVHSSRQASESGSEALSQFSSGEYQASPADSELHLGLTILELEAIVADAEIENGCYGKGWAK